MPEYTIYIIYASVGHVRMDIISHRCCGLIVVQMTCACVLRVLGRELYGSYVHACSRKFDSRVCECVVLVIRVCIVVGRALLCVFCRGTGVREP